MADLHDLDPAGCGLGDFGGPAGFVERQVAGWVKRREVASSMIRRLRSTRSTARLLGSLPALSRVYIVHNDLQLDNCQFAPAQPDRVKSIFDPDMTTLGDPLIDLGTLLNYWPDPDNSEATAAGDATGPCPDGLAAPRRDCRALRRTERGGWWQPYLVGGVSAVED